MEVKKSAQEVQLPHELQKGIIVVEMMDERLTESETESEGHRDHLVTVTLYIAAVTEQRWDHTTTLQFQHLSPMGRQKQILLHTPQRAPRTASNVKAGTERWQQ